MIARSLGEIVSARLRQFPAAALIGPRQVGKTTLARWRYPQAGGIEVIGLTAMADALAELEPARGA